MLFLPAGFVRGPFAGDWGVRPVPGRGEVRRRLRGFPPLSSSGQTALYSGRPAGEGIPHTASLPLLFPTATATLGCGGVPLSVEKENAPFDGVREKGSGGGIPDFVRNARGACYGGFGLVVTDGLDHSTVYGGFGSWGKFRMPFCSSFAAAHWQLREIGGRSRSRIPPASLLLTHPGSC